jgi:uncharacterized protein involved in exopolysaccharide biosynthesis
MALTAIPRDRLERVVHLGRKTWRYAWLVAVLAIAGAALSVAYAATRPKHFRSWSTLFYQERIQTQILTPGRDDGPSRGLGDRYRELLLARPQLEQILADPALDPFPDERDPRVKLDKLRLAIRFTARGAGAFRIEYTDRDPERARLVTDRLAELLRSKDDAIRRDQAFATVRFIVEQQHTETAELDKHERAHREFIARHPEFASPTGRSPVASPAPSRASRLDILRAQASRLRVLLAGPAAPAATPPMTPPMTPPTSDRLAAEAAVADATRELRAAQHALDDALRKFTSLHPTARDARARLDLAQQRLRLAQAALPPATDPIPALTSDVRARLTAELGQLERQIAHEQARRGTTNDAALTADRLVQLELEHSALQRAVAEQHERVRLLSDEAFRTTMAANRTLAEQGGRLSVIDPAFTPLQPTGPGKSIVLIAGLLLFITLGFSLAIALATIDDRLYRRIDIDHLGIPTLAVIPPATLRKRKRRRERSSQTPPTM